MKKTAIALTICLLLTGVVWAAAASAAGDPLISLSYLTDVFLGRVEQETDKKLDSSDKKALEQAAETGEAPVSALWTEACLKQNDVVLGAVGGSVLHLAGQVQVSYYGGAVVDVTTGTVVTDGTILEANHRYLVAEETSAVFVVLSKTAVLNWQGDCQFQYSDCVEYHAMASALKQLHLFRGSGTGYAEGFDLHKVPTRLQALIMFIRVLGEEEEALAWSGTNPFQDVERDVIGRQYVGYAYEKGYTNGVSKTAFLPSSPVNAAMYTEFVLRALGYSSVSTTDISDALERAQAAAVLTPGEVAMFHSGEFLRADLAYISYYALDAVDAESGKPLSQVLEAKGVFTRQEFREARKLVEGGRIF